MLTKMMNSLIAIFLSCLSLCAFCGCKSAVQEERHRQLEQRQNDLFSYGMVKRFVKKGATTQAEIIQKFGAPSITTTDSDGNEVWMYERTSTEQTSYSAESASSFWNESEGAIHTTVSTTSLMVVFSFDEKGIVKDYSARSTRF